MRMINLKDLSYRESESVEWKKSVADITDIIKTAVAFANDYSNLGGGYIVCGAEETKDEHGFQKLVETGLSASEFKKIEGQFLTDLRAKVTPPIVALTEEIPLSDNKRILVFIIPASKNSAHQYKAAYYIRIGRETREAKNGILRDLLTQKHQMEPWDKGALPRAVDKENSCKVGQVRIGGIRHLLTFSPGYNSHKPKDRAFPPSSGQ